MSRGDVLVRIHCACCFIWEDNVVYYLVTATDMRYKSSGASTLIVWETLKFLSDKTKSFDFEGSMIESVEQSYNQFGTVQMPYFNIKYVPNKLIEMFI